MSGAEFVHLGSDGTKLVAQRRWMRHVEVVQGPPVADADAAAVPLEDWLATRALGGDELRGYPGAHLVARRRRVLPVHCRVLP